MLFRSHGFLLRCIPKEEERQHLEYYRLDIWPETEVKVADDFWKNTTVQGIIVRPHRSFGFNICGEVTVDLSRPRKTGHPIFAYPTEFTQTSPAMEALTERLLREAFGDVRQVCTPQQPEEKQANALSKALCLMNGLYDIFEYRQNVTRTTTTAAEAFALGQGVCQGYADRKSVV